MQIHEKYNLTPFIADTVFLKDRDGRNRVKGIIKASFEFDEKGIWSIPPRERMLPVMMSDVYYGEPGQSSVQYPCDTAPEKDGTDIILNGHAYGKREGRVSCGLSLGYLKKNLDVTGNRFWSKRVMGYHILGPLPFDRIPLHYENAFGGSYVDPKKGTVRYDENPVGKGFGAKQQDRTPLPNIEYGSCLIKSLKHTPKPAGFGAIDRAWKQRLVYAGTYDDRWKTDIFPSLPEDFDKRFYNAAPDDQIYRPVLKGGEALTLVNLHPKKKKLLLTIPNSVFSCTFKVKQSAETLPMSMETCLIEPDEGRLTMTYGCTLAMDCDVKYLKTIHFEVRDGK